MVKTNALAQADTTDPFFLHVPCRLSMQASFNELCIFQVVTSTTFKHWQLPHSAAPVKQDFVSYVRTDLFASLIEFISLKYLDFYLFSFNLPE